MAKVRFGRNFTGCIKILIMLHQGVALIHLHGYIYSNYSGERAFIYGSVFNFQPVITINNNIDEMISYACIAWTFAGRFKKVVLTPDFIDGFPDLGEYLTNSIIEHE